MKVLPQNMRKAASQGFINATDCADYLTKKGMPFRDAYTVIGKVVAYCTQKSKTLEDLTIEEYKEVSELFDNDIYDTIKLENCVKKRIIPGGPAPEIVSEHIQRVKNSI